MLESLLVAGPHPLWKIRRPAANNAMERNGTRMFSVAPTEDVCLCEKDSELVKFSENAFSFRCISWRKSISDAFLYYFLVG